MRLRDVLAVLVGLAVVGAVALGGWRWLTDTIEGETPSGPAPGEDAAATAAAYLDAWASGDLTAMAALVRDPPSELVPRHQQLLDALAPASIALEAGAVDDSVDGRAAVPVRVSLVLEELEQPVTWDTELVLLRQAGRWAVSWTISTLHPELRPTWTFGREVEQLGRAPILAADGAELAGTGTQVTFGFEPTAVDDPEAVVAAFEEAVPGSGSRAERELSRDDLVDGWFYPVVTVSGDRAEDVAPVLRGVRGILRQQREGRTLYAEGFARHVVGVVDEATAEDLERLGAPYRPGDHVGRFGLEGVFETRLVGAEVVRVGLRDGTDGPMRVLLAEGTTADAGPVRTTLDVTVQQAVENALVGVGQPAAIVVVDGRDGAIRGSASRPLTGYNRAWEGRYPPGSTFKVVVLEALLAAGAQPSDPVSCPAETTVGGLRVPNAGARNLGDTDLATAFAASCNTTFARLGADTGAEAIAAAAARFGFGVEPLVPLPAVGGSFPEPADTAELAAASFGQARVEASPLHLAAMVAATTTGVWHPPYLLVADGPGESRPLATGTVDGLRALLRLAVESGTGSAAAVDGEVVGGKTGTAQGTDGATHAWFVGTWGELGFAVLVEGGGAGGEVAAPIAGRLVRELATLAAAPPS